MSNGIQFRIGAVMVAFVPLLLAAGPNEKPDAPVKDAAATKEADSKQPATVFQDADRFKRLLILSDASGSMINKMAVLKDQINRTVAALKPEQAFGIVFMQDRSFDRFNDKLVPAGADQKKAAGKFLERVTTTGTTDPIPGLELAFKQKPDLIYLLTDGDFPDNEAVLKKVRQLNKDKKVKIYTIAFVDKADTDTNFITLLKTIAEESGGKYAHVDEEDDRWQPRPEADDPSTKPTPASK